MPHARRQKKTSPEQLQQDSINSSTSSSSGSADTPSNRTQYRMPSQLIYPLNQPQGSEFGSYFPQGGQYVPYYLQQYPPPGGGYSWPTPESRQSYSSSSGSGEYQSSETTSSEESRSKRRRKDDNSAMNQQREVGSGGVNSFVTRNGESNQTSNPGSGSSNTFDRHRDTINSGSDNSDMKYMWSPAKRDVLEKSVSKEVEKKLRARSTVDIEEISWDQVAANLTGETEDSCKRMWLQLYPDHVLSKQIDGSIVVMKKIGVVSEASPSETLKNSDAKPTTDLELNKGSGFKLPRVRWTEEEKAMVARMQRLLGHKWTLIAAKMNTGKTASQVKRYWTTKVLAEHSKEDNQDQ